MSEQIETLAGQVEWGAKNLAYNLDFVPDDKLSWKPAPSANSALEIVGHLVMALTGLKGHIESELAGGKFEFSHEAPVYSTREEAKAALLSAAQQNAQTLRAIPASDLEKPVALGFGTFPLAFLAQMSATDTLHHHGQIAYLQTLLGDTESHFDMSLMGQ